MSDDFPEGYTPAQVWGYIFDWLTRNSQGVLAMCGILGLPLAVATLVYLVRYADDTRTLTRETQLQNRQQRILEWFRLTDEDTATAPDLVAVTIAPKAGSDPHIVEIELFNWGKGPTKEVMLDDAATGTDLLHQPLEIKPGTAYDFSVPDSKFDRKRLMRISARSQHGSIRIKTFYFLADNQFRPISDTTDTPYDFLIADEPGRRNRRPSAFFGFGPPTGDPAHTAAAAPAPR